MAKRMSPKKRSSEREHIGFEAAAREAAESYGGDTERGRAAIAASTRRASAKAKRRNPRLKRVRG